MCQNRFLELFFRTVVMNPKDYPDKCQGSVPVCDNHPTLVITSVGAVLCTGSRYLKVFKIKESLVLSIRGAKKIAIGEPSTPIISKTSKNCWVS
jgi:hypothetical protein